jgi:hypothetical protein
VALNMATRRQVDLPLQLHFALFNGSGGFVLKPTEMRAESNEWGSPSISVTPEDSFKGRDSTSDSRRDSQARRDSQGAITPSFKKHRESQIMAGLTASLRTSGRSSAVQDDASANDWPPPREQLSRTTIDIFSLHNSPKVGSFFSLRGFACLYHVALPPHHGTQSLPGCLLSCTLPDHACDRNVVHNTARGAATGLRWQSSRGTQVCPRAEWHGGPARQA